MSRRAIPLLRLEPLLSSPNGLTESEVQERREEYGPNAILETPRHPWWDLVRDTAKDPMLWFFGGTSGLYAVVGQHGEALTLLVAILPLLGMDVYLHRRTQASTEGLKSRLAARATVLREGKAVTIPAIDVVPGDLALVSTGESFPADGLVVEGEGLQADESALTGEAYPVTKRPLVEPPRGGSEPLVDEEHWGFAGTRLLTGSAQLRVAFTGGETVYGEIVRSAVHGTHESTPLQQALRSLVQTLLLAAMVGCLFLAGVRLLQGHGWLDALVSPIYSSGSAKGPGYMPLRHG
jgi:Ca2+-transporting ATPase